MAAKIKIVDLYTRLSEHVHRRGVTRVRTYYVVLRLAGLRTSKLRISKAVYEKLKR